MRSLFGSLFGESETEYLQTENSLLREQQFRQIEYIRKKINQLLLLMGTLPLRPDEFDDDSLIETDPIGTVAESFAQILEHEKQLNEKLQLIHDELRAIISSAGTGILVVDRTMRIQMHNQKITEYFSLTTEELMGKCCCQVLCNSDGAPPFCTFERVMESRRTVHQPDWMRGGRHYDVVGTPVRNKLGDISCVVLAYNDISNNIENEKRMKEREQVYTDLFESLSDMVLCLLPDGSFLSANRVWRESLGFRPEELGGLKFWNVIAPEYRKQGLAYFNALMHGSRSERVRTVFFGKDGSYLPVEGHMRSSVSNGRTIAVLASFRVATDGAGEKRPT